MSELVKRAVRNSVIITVVVGVVVNFQGATIYTSLMTMLYTFVVITPALWLSYRFIQKIIKK